MQTLRSSWVVVWLRCAFVCVCAWLLAAGDGLMDTAGGSRLAMLLQGGSHLSARRMGGGASQSGAMAAAAGSSPPAIFASTTAKAAASDIPLLFSELHGAWAALE